MFRPICQSGQFANWPDWQIGRNIYITYQYSRPSYMQFYFMRSFPCWHGDDCQYTDWLEGVARQWSGLVIHMCTCMLCFKGFLRSSSSLLIEAVCLHYALHQSQYNAVDQFFSSGTVYMTNWNFKPDAF